MLVPYGGNACGGGSCSGSGSGNGSGSGRGSGSGNRFVQDRELWRQPTRTQTSLPPLVWPTEMRDLCQTTREAPPMVVGRPSQNGRDSPGWCPGCHLVALREGSASGPPHARLDLNALSCGGLSSGLPRQALPRESPGFSRPWVGLTTPTAYIGRRRSNKSPTTDEKPPRWLGVQRPGGCRTTWGGNPSTLLLQGYLLRHSGLRASLEGRTKRRSRRGATFERSRERRMR